MIRILIQHFLLICVLLLAGIFYFLTMTTAGLKTDIELAMHYLPGKLHIGEANGTLFSEFNLQNISYQNASEQIAIQSFALKWKPIGLLVNRWVVESISVAQADVIIKNLPVRSTKTTTANADFSKFLRRIVIQQINLNHVTLQLNDTRIDLNGSLVKNWDVNWRIDVPHLAVFIPKSTGSLLTSGSIVGPLWMPTIKAVVQGKNLFFLNQQIARLKGETTIVVQPKINSTLHISATGLNIYDHPLKTFDLSASGNITREKNKLSANLNALFDKQYPVAAILILPKFSRLNDLEQPIAGKIDSSIRNLEFLTAWIPQIKNPRGILNSNILVSGTLEHPKLAGNLSLTNGQVRIPELGITLQEIYLQGQTSLNNELHFNGNFRSGKGSAALQGVFDFNQPNYPVTLTIKGKELQAINLAEYHVVISPDLTLKYTQQNLQLQGNIGIPYAEISPKNFNSTVTLPSDVVFVGSKQTVNSLPFTTQLQLNLLLGDKIHVAYNNLQANLAGSVILTQEPGALINAAGELYTKSGTYTAYGQTLTIQTGRLIYTGGSLMNPGLNISAVKQIKTVSIGGNISNFTGTTNLQPVYTGAENITVGVHVMGTLETPALTLFSNPTLSQGDILSYLVFGFPQSEASGHEYGALLSALSSLNPNTSRIGDITKKMQQKFGFNELNVESTQVFDPNTNSTVSTTTVGVGKQLSENLSMHYSIGLFYPVSILNLRYKISKSWAIQSETSTIDNGADLLYSIERD